MSNTPTVIITHHAASMPWHTADDVNKWHYARWPNFKSERGFWTGYHYVIDKNGQITNTRYEYEEGAHTIGMNLRSIGVCFMGNFDKEYPTGAQIASWDRLYKELLTRYPSIPVVPHRLYANKSCHGKLLPDDYFVAASQKIALIKKLEAMIIRLTALLTKKRQSLREKHV